MNRLLSNTAVVGLVLGASGIRSAPLQGQMGGRPPSDSGSAAIRDVKYDLTFTRATAEQRVVDVTMTFATTGTAPVLLSLPAWTPGAYEISNFARWVTRFAATSDGHAIVWDKLD